MISFYFENLSVSSFLGLILSDRVARTALRQRSATIFYIDKSRSGKLIILPLFRMARLSVSRCCFEMRNIKDRRGELLRLRIFRHDLFDLRSRIVSSEEFKALESDHWDRDGIRAFIEKGVTDGQIMERQSVSRLAYLVGVVKAHAGNEAEPVLIVERRPWSGVLEKYGREQGVRVVFTPWLEVLSRGRLAAFRYKFPRTYTIMRAFKDYGWPTLRHAHAKGRRARVYVEGRGEVRLRNDGYHTDFHWLLNSSLAPASVCYTAQSPAEAQTLRAFGVSVVGVRLGRLISCGDIVAAPIREPSRLRQEKKMLGSLLQSYCALRTFWRTIFDSNEVKIFLTWYRYERGHVAIGDAVRDVGGLAVGLPIAFDGCKMADITTKFDIVFATLPLRRG